MMTVSSRRWLLVLLVLTGWSIAVVAQTDSLTFRPDIERLFVEAMRHFQNAQFDSAASKFQKCMKEFPFNHRTTGA